MKLRGSLTERKIRDGMLAANRALANRETPRLLSGIVAADANPATTYILDLIPEEHSDIYVLMPSLLEVLTIELAPNGTPEAIRRESIDGYKERAGRSMLLRIAVAEQLIREGQLRSLQ